MAMERLECVVQDYAWGDPASIPELLGLPLTGAPAAELWMGAHPKAPSVVVDRDMTLDRLIASAPDDHLGAALSGTFGRLPFLFKVLAAAQPLSIQSHPTLGQAQAGFAREEAAGIDIGSPLRTYRDDNHKPELICALTHFVAKVGFKPLADTRALFVALGGEQLAPLRERLVPDGSPEAEQLGSVLKWLLELPPREVGPVVAAVLGAAEHCTEDRFAPELRWVATVHDHFPGDIGGVVALLLNHVELQPGEAVFLGAGNLHAYLQGTGMELMANSDNVVRGGLTPKNIDINELLDVVDASPITPDVQRTIAAVHTYTSPVPEFSLTRVAGADAALEPGPHILIVVEGRYEASTDTGSLVLEQGNVVYAPASDGPLRLSGNGVAFVASPGTHRG